MVIHEVEQGSEEWLALRRQYCCASDAPAMMGASPFVSRDELIARMVTGMEKEHSQATMERFAAGKKAEASFREHAEALLGEDLYPVVASTEIDGVRLLASFDGLTLDRRTIWEHKLWSEDVARHVQATGMPPERDIWQLEHQLAVSGAESVLYTVSDGTPKRMASCLYTSSPERREQLIAGWRQLMDEVKARLGGDAKPSEPVQEVVVGRAPESLPTLRIELSGAVVASNLTEFRDAALAVFRSINRDLQTDQDFADAERTAKWCAEVESRLKAAKEHALSQTAEIDRLFKAIDDIAAEARTTRLELEKLVQKRKDAIKSQVLEEAARELHKHVQSWEAKIGKPYMPRIEADFAGAAKNKRTLQTLREAVAEELARAKVSANVIGAKIAANVAWIAANAEEHRFLLTDEQALVQQDPAAMQAIIMQRIAAHKERVAKQVEAEREKIRQEESARAAAAQAAPTAQAAVAAELKVIEDEQKRLAEAKQVITPKTLQDALGIMVSEYLLSQLGFVGSVVRGIRVYPAEEFIPICDALAEYIRRRGTQYARNMGIAKAAKKAA